MGHGGLRLDTDDKGYEGRQGGGQGEDSGGDEREALQGQVIPACLVANRCFFYVDRRLIGAVFRLLSIEGAQE